MSLYGYERETTPFLTEFAERSTLYTQARSPGIHSIASHVSMFTGEHVEEHEALHHTAQIDPEQSIWTELRGEFGYATGLFTNNRIVSNASNLGSHFDYQFNPEYSLAKRLENTLGNPSTSASTTPPRGSRRSRRPSPASGRSARLSAGQRTESARCWVAKRAGTGRMTTAGSRPSTAASSLTGSSNGRQSRTVPGRPASI